MSGYVDDVRDALFLLSDEIRRIRLGWGGGGWRHVWSAVCGLGRVLMGDR